MKFTKHLIKIHWGISDDKGNLQQKIYGTRSQARQVAKSTEGHVVKLQVV